MQIAQTNIQLYNQLRWQGFALEDLITVHDAYEFLTTLYPGHFQADGKPFVSHGVGVASILAELDQPAEILVVGLLHNVYGNADFGDGPGGGATASRRRLVREAVGDQVDRLLVRFAGLRILPHTLRESQRALAQRDETERRLILVELADHLEKYVDLGVLYFGEGDWVIGTTERIGGGLIEIASELGQPRLAGMLSSALATAIAERSQVPAALRSSDGRPALKLFVPRSCRLRLSVRVRSRIRQLRWRLRPRTRLRGLRSSAARSGRASA